MVRAQRFGASAAEIRTRIEPKLPAEPNGAGSVGFKRELYSDAGWATQTAKHPTRALTRPPARHANYTPNNILLGRLPLHSACPVTLTPLRQ
jgi:hypothetical protein